MQRRRSVRNGNRMLRAVERGKIPLKLSDKLPRRRNPAAFHGLSHIHLGLFGNQRLINRNMAAHFLKILAFASPGYGPCLISNSRQFGGISRLCPPPTNNIESPAAIFIFFISVHLMSKSVINIFLPFST